jgi:MFS family permease
MALQRTRSLFSSDALLALGTTVFATSLWGVAEFKSIALLSVAILFGGIAWTAIISLMTTVMQNLAPDWIRARAMAVFMLVYMGTGTAGSTFWGYVAGRQGTHVSLIAAAIGTAVCPILVLISHLPDSRRTTQALGVSVFPSLIILDGAGRIRMIHSGYDASEHLARQVVKEVSALAGNHP